jgi:hypothetical protein
MDEICIERVVDVQDSLHLAAGLGHILYKMLLPAAYKNPVIVSPPYVCRSLPLALYVLRKIIYVQLRRAREHNILIQSYPKYISLSRRSPF